MSFRCSPTAVNDAASNVVIPFEANVVVKFVAVHQGGQTHFSSIQVLVNII